MKSPRSNIPATLGLVTSILIASPSWAEEHANSDTVIQLSPFQALALSGSPDQQQAARSLRREMGGELKRKLSGCWGMAVPYSAVHVLVSLSAAPGLGFQVASVRIDRLSPEPSGAFPSCTRQAMDAMVGLQFGSKRLRYKLGDLAGDELFILQPPSAGRCPGT